MSKFYYFLNPSGSLSLLLSSCCPVSIDELMNAWLAGWVLWSSHPPGLGSFLKRWRENKEGGIAYWWLLFSTQSWPCVCLLVSDSSESGFLGLMCEWPCSLNCLGAWRPACCSLCREECPEGLLTTHTLKSIQSLWDHKSTLRWCYGQTVPLHTQILTLKS